MSSLSHSGSTVAVEALQRGAVDVVGKPMNASEMENFAPLLREKVRAAAISRKLRRRHTLPPQAVSQQRAPTGQSYRARQLICIGASTGGTEAIKDVLQRLPAGLPGIAVVQHIPAGFSRAFADRLNTICAMEVREATHGEILGSGLALVAPGNYHMRLDWTGQHFRVCLDQSAPIWHQRPAVDALFESAAKAAGGEACGVILTGMGRDGAAGLAAMRKAGAQTFAQDEATSVVYGMPRVAWESGAAGKQVALGGVSRAIIQSLGARRMSAA
jgi:two-component system chemotaxis response regulator CheB